MNATIQASTPPLDDPVPPAAKARGARISELMRSQPIWVVLILPVILTLFVGWVDDVTGWEVSLFVFYAIPIVMVVWWSGITSGIVISVLSGVVWWVANQDVSPYETTLGFFWALLNRECYFGVVIFAVHAVRSKQEADDSRIRELEERRQLEADLVTVSEHEQQRIGQDLHDGLCQHLAAIGLAAQSLADELKSQQNPSSEDASMIQQSIHAAVSEARSMARGIFPVHVDRHGLAVALTELAATTSRLTGVQIEVVEDGDVQISPPEAAMHLYRIAQEAVGNAVRHGGAQKVRVCLQSTQDSIVLLVSDDGRGFPILPSKNEGMGLRTMRYRAQMIGASLTVSTPDPRGATLQCVVPIHHN